MLYLIRHGQASFSSDNYDKLSTLGEQQAQLMGQELASMKLDGMPVVRGSMLRHQQTCELATQHFKASPDTKVHNDARWNEYEHQHILSCYDSRFATPAQMKAHLMQSTDPKAAFQQAFMGAMKRWMSDRHDSDYHETWGHFTARVLAAFETVCTTTPNALVFTSGGPISLVTCHLLGMPLTDFMRVNWTLVNTSMTKVRVDSASNASRLVSSNEHNYLVKQDKSWVTYT